MSLGTRATLIAIFFYFLQFLQAQANFYIVLRLGHCIFLPNPFQFLDLSSYHLTLHILGAGGTRTEVLTMLLGCKVTIKWTERKQEKSWKQGRSEITRIRIVNSLNLTDQVNEILCLAKPPAVRSIQENWIISSSPSTFVVYWTCKSLIVL
jgi:hypothetical protein